MFAHGAISCQIDSPTRDVCIKEALQDMLPKLKNGMAYLNIPPLDPYTINDTTIEYKRGDIYAVLTLKTATFHGMSEAEIREVRTKIDDYGMSTEVDVFMPHLSAEGMYKANGRFNSLKINAKGAFNMKLKDTATTHKFKGVFETRDGERFLKIESYDVIPTIGDLKVQMTGIFQDPELNKIAVEFINQYWPLFYRDMIPETKAIWEPILLTQLNAFMLRLPINRMLF
ncbi:hypothetical protein Bhyg_04467 [Pseudolycoriella hygida]|uniref:Circadian clock-controlled protein n=1 Tax=Pseudolycoriella hygida TaxID=35572 RepID=A0A9Q0NFC1_9DIPT|nr:hypothetical protein Bhyg_04467 [Pseudolycoriella hygida]